MKCGGESMSWRQSRTPFVGSRSVRMAPAAFNETSKTRTTLGHLGRHVVARAVPPIDTTHQEAYAPHASRFRRHPKLFAIDATPV